MLRFMRAGISVCVVMVLVVGVMFFGECSLSLKSLAIAPNIGQAKTSRKWHTGM